MEPGPSKARYWVMTSQEADTTLRFAFIGDLCLGGEFIPYVEKNEIDFLYPFKNVSGQLKDCDIVFINLEGPIFEGPDKRSDVTAILSNHPAIIDFFAGFKLCVLNLANNHIMDYGPEGLIHTISLLENNQLHYVGAGTTEEEANRELIVEYKNRHISFLSCTTDEKHVRSIVASPYSPGCATLLNTARLTSQIQKLKQKTDIVCVALHWGHEYFQYPTPSQIETAHALVDAGADYVIGHHPHAIQGIEKYKNALIIYSLGNFFFPPFKAESGRIRYPKRLSREYMIVQSEISNDSEVNYQLTGGINKDYLLTPYRGGKDQDFVQKIKNISIPLHLNDYDFFWSGYEKKRLRELTKESLYEAVYKLIKTPITDWIRLINIKDVKRNVTRIMDLIKTN